MKLEFFEPAEAAALLKCSEAWLRDGAVNGRFPHSVWGKGKIVFTSTHLKRIAHLQEVPVNQAPAAAGGAVRRTIGTRAQRRPA